jgi:hypothetical protein
LIAQREINSSSHCITFPCLSSSDPVSLTFSLTPQIGSKDISVAGTDHFLFHSPYNKLVQKSFARVVYLDMMSGSADSSSIAQWKGVDPTQTYEDKELEAALKGAAGPLYKQKVALGCELSKQVRTRPPTSLYHTDSKIITARITSNSPTHSIPSPYHTTPHHRRSATRTQHPST